MPINSRKKGAAAELEVAHYFKKHGLEARRGQQFKGGSDSPDVVCDHLPAYHFEVKRVEQGNLYRWMEQAINDIMGTKKTPVVVHRRNGEQWVAIISLDEFLKLAKLRHMFGEQDYV